MVMVYRVVCTSQTKTHFLEGRKWKKKVGELGNVACHNKAHMQGIEEESEGGWETGEKERPKRRRTLWGGGRGRSGVVSLETRHNTNEDSHPGEEEEEGVGW